MKATRTWEIILVLLLLVVVGGFGATTEGFLDFYNLSDSTFNYSEKALIALAMALVIIAGDIDISVAATVALSSVMMGLAKNAGAGPMLIVLVGLGSGALCGALNGFLITRFALPSIVVTIGTLSLYRGTALVILGDGAITGYPPALSTLGNGYIGDLIGLPWLQIPIEFAIFVIAAIIIGVVLHKTIIGRRIYSIGANPIASRFSGIAVNRYRLMLFIFVGTFAGLASVLLTGRIGSTRPNIAMGWELDAITMVILGGVSINGGSGSLLGVVLAIIVLGMFTFGLQMMNVPGIVMSMILGGLLIVSMIVPILIRSRKPRVAKAA
ncbi:MAG: ABC transporter permease [Propionivibrio sp.]|nr:ABC transporter permease [Propionivibrio sp.]